MPETVKVVIDGVPPALAFGAIFIGGFLLVAACIIRGGLSEIAEALRKVK